jgi:hypothetical protein
MLDDFPPVPDAESLPLYRMVSKASLCVCMCVCVWRTVFSASSSAADDGDARWCPPRSWRGGRATLCRRLRAEEEEGAGGWRTRLHGVGVDAEHGKEAEAVAVDARGDEAGGGAAAERAGGARAGAERADQAAGVERVLAGGEDLLGGELEGLEADAALAVDGVEVAGAGGGEVHGGDVLLEDLVADDGGAEFVVDEELCRFGLQSLLEFHLIPEEAEISGWSAAVVGRYQQVLILCSTILQAHELIIQRSINSEHEIESSNSGGIFGCGWMIGVEVC